MYIYIFDIIMFYHVLREKGGRGMTGNSARERRLAEMCTHNDEEDHRPEGPSQALLQREDGRKEVIVTRKYHQPKNIRSTCFQSHPQTHSP